MASEIFNDKNAVFKKLKAKSENKVCVYIYIFLWICDFCAKFDLGLWDLIQIWEFPVWILISFGGFASDVLRL